MDIVVTIPKSEYLNDDLEKESLKKGDLLAFWTLHRVPKRLSLGDRVYFVKRGRIDSSMEVVKIQHESEEVCSTTGRHWVGKCQLFLDNLREEELTMPETKGFQGFRYKWWE